jgi:hypothetical protein
MKHAHAWRRFLTALALGAWGQGCGVQGEAEAWEAQPVDTLEQRVVTQDTDDPPGQQLKNDVAAVLEEYQSVPQVHPVLVPPQLQPDLKVAQNVSKLWVTFFDEGAGRRNALGYFTWPEGQQPSGPPSLTTRKANIIFANASKVGDGGTLVQGNRMLLGSFPAGTRVGFFIIAGACSTDTGCTADNIDYSKPTYYTIDAWNPEVAPDKKRHVVLVHHEDAQRLVMGFENQDREGTTDDDFNDVVFVVSWDPLPAIGTTYPGLDPDPTCQRIKTRYPAALSGIYRLDTCGNGVVDNYYCDMTTPGADGRVGGWTLGGWQPASAKTSLGVTSRGTVGSADWSSNLACVPFQEALVFNQTKNESFTQVLPFAHNGLKQVPFALGEAGRSFVQGTYGPSDSLVMMGCVRYAYDGTVYAEWACVTDWRSGGMARGHIADYAVEYNCNPIPMGARWAWADDASCRYAGEPYTWGIGVR